MVLKITYILTRSDFIGGASVHLLDLAHGARRAGHDVKILVGGIRVFFESARERGLSCFSLNYMRGNIELVTDFLGFFEVRKFIKKLRPGTVYVHSSKTGVLGRLACEIFSVPVILTAHGWAYTEGVSGCRCKIYTFMERYKAQISDSPLFLFRIFFWREARIFSALYVVYPLVVFWGVIIELPLFTMIFIEVVGIIFSISLLAMMGSTPFKTWLPRIIGKAGVEAS